MIEQGKTSRAKQPLKGAEKVAAVFLALGRESAVKIGDYLTKEELKAVVQAAGNLPALSVEEVDLLIKDFGDNYLSSGLMVGSNGLGKILNEISPATGANSPANKKSNSASEEKNSLDMEMVKGFLETEPPMISALLLDTLGEDTAAQILSALEPELRNEIFNQYLNRKQLDPAIESMLAADLLALLNNSGENDENEQVVEKAAGLINYMPDEASESLVDFIKNDDPQLADRISRSLFRFAMVEQLDKESRSQLFDVVQADEIAKALINSSDTLKEKVLEVLSQRNRRMIESEIAQGAAPELVTEAQRKISGLALKLAKEGKVRMPGSDEQSES